MKEWSSAVPLLTIVFASGYILGRNSPAIPPVATEDARAGVIEQALPAWHPPVLSEPMPRGRLMLPDRALQDAPPGVSLPPGHPVIPDEMPADPTDQLDRDGIERDPVVTHPREPIRT